MLHRIIASTALAIPLLLSADLALATDAKPPALAASSAAIKAVAPTANTKIPAKPVAKAKKTTVVPAKLVDINGADKAALMKLPGVSEADAAKIIAGRPYGSKAWLTTRNIISAEKYTGLKGLVIAKQPNNDAAKNAALYKTKK